MLVFIDESGCSGFKQARGSDAVFAIGMVIFDDIEAAVSTRQQLGAVRAGLKHGFEFKFSKLNNRRRRNYLSAVAACEFRIRALVVEKQRVDPHGFHASQDDFHSYFVKQLLQRASGRLKNARLFIDGDANRSRERRLKVDLRRLLGTQVSHLRMVDSRREELMQLTDMCVGAVAHSFRTGLEADDWLRLLGPRIEEIYIPLP
jgi:hypothetical protein